MAGNQINAGTQILPSSATVLLDAAFSATEGAVLYRGASAWAALAPGVAGQALITGGAGEPPAWGNVQTVATTGTTGLTNWYNQGGATAANSSQGIVMTSGSNGGSNNAHWLYTSAPATPYTVSALVTCTRTPVGAGYDLVGIGWIDPSVIPGRAETIGGFFNSTANEVIVLKFDSATATEGITYNSGYGPNFPLYLQLSNDGTTVSLKYSYDGANFTTGYSEPAASGWMSSGIGGSNNYAKIGIFVNSVSTVNVFIVEAWSVS